MIKILFICHGNICRSVMAEYIMKDLIKKEELNDKFYIESKATSAEEIGNDIYYLAKDQLIKNGIQFSKHRARQIKKSDLDEFDYIIAMEKYNIDNLVRMFGPSNKYSMLLSYVGKNKDIEDPWYTGDFDKVYKEIEEGVKGLISYF